MPTLKAYHRPQSVDEALQLLSRPDVTSIILAGGTSTVPHIADDVDEVIDLQAAGLDQIEASGGQLTLGATVSLQQIAEHPATPGLLRDMIRYEAPSTFRNVATIGGTVASADWESEVVAALLVFDATLTIQNKDGSRQVPLAEFVTDPAGNLDKGLITSVRLATDGETAHQRVARTPMDKPIVAVCGRKMADGTIRLAFCGVAAAPVLLSTDQLNNLNPPADFRGSSAYRKQMAATLRQRVIASLG